MLGWLTSGPAQRAALCRTADAIADAIADALAEAEAEDVARSAADEAAHRLAASDEDTAAILADYLQAVGA